MDRNENRARAGALLADWNESPDRQDGVVGRLTAADAPTIEMVGALDDEAAGGLLARVASSAGSKEIRKAARRGLHRLRAAGRAVPEIPPSGPPPMLRAQVDVRLAQVTASFPDGMGSRGLWLFAERSTGGGFFFGTVLNELVGMKGCFVGEATKRRFAERVDEIKRSVDLPWVDLPVDYGRALLAEALALNEAGGVAIPQDFQTWGAVLGDLGEPPARAAIYDLVNSAEIQLDPTFLDQSDELLDEPEIGTWLLDFHAMRPYVEQLKQARSSQLVLNDEAQKEREERVMNAVVRDLFTEQFRGGLRRRLEEAAYVYLRLGRDLAAKRAVAAAIALEQPLLSETVIVRVSQVPSRAQHPFARTLVERSLEFAQQVDEAGLADSIPKRSVYDPIE